MTNKELARIYRGIHDASAIDIQGALAAIRPSKDSEYLDKIIGCCMTLAFRVYCLEDKINRLKK